jgi:hypothetical protein
MCQPKQSFKKRFEESCANPWKVKMKIFAESCANHNKVKRPAGAELCQAQVKLGLAKPATTSYPPSQLNSAQLKLELGLSLAKIVWKSCDSPNKVKSKIFVETYSNRTKLKKSKTFAGSCANPNKVNSKTFAESHANPNKWRVHFLHVWHISRELSKHRAWQRIVR